MKNNFIKDNIVSFIIIIVSVLLVAGLGGLFVNLGTSWYDTLKTPTQYPPDFIFALVWSIVYLSFIVILCIWEAKWDIPTNIIVLLIINGALNVLWCLVFFTLKQTFLGLIVILLNLIFAIILWKKIFKEEKIYAYVLSLYPIWICIATCLNLSTWILN